MAMFDNLEIKDEDLLEVEDDTIDPSDEIEVEDEEVEIEELEINDDEEEEKEEKPKVKPSKLKSIEKQESVEDNNDNPFQAFAYDLRDLEFLPDISEEELKNIKDPATLGDIFNKQLNSKLEQWEQELIDAHDSRTNGALSHILNGGKIEDYKAESMGVYGSNISEKDIEESEDLQKRIVVEYYRRKGFKDQRANKMAEESIELEKDALEFLVEMQEEDKVKIDQNKKRIKEQEEQNRKIVEQRTSKIKNTVFETKEFIPGRKLTQETREKVYNNIPDVVKKINENIEQYAPILAYLDYYKLLDGDFTKVLKENTTLAVSRLSKVLDTKTRKEDKPDNDLYEAAKWSVERFKRK